MQTLVCPDPAYGHSTYRDGEIISLLKGSSHPGCCLLSHSQHLIADAIRKNPIFHHSFEHIYEKIEKLIEHTIKNRLMTGNTETTKTHPPY